MHIVYIEAHFLCTIFENNYFGRFLSSKHVQPSSGEPEVVVASKVSHNAWQNYIIGTYSMVNYSNYYQNTNHRSWDNVKEHVINNDFDVTFPSGRRYFWTRNGNTTQTLVIIPHSIILVIFNVKYR